jgi:glycosyltransferase involved in cell wall biosynthesis
MTKKSDGVDLATNTTARQIETVQNISIVVPIYNEVENIPDLYRQLTQALGSLGREYEILMVDDGSTDGSQQLITDLANTDPKVRLISFRRNYGQTAAMQAGVDHAKMDVVVTIDGDLQNDPADIGRMIAKLEEGYDLVHGWRRDRKDALISRKLPSRIANRLISRVTRFPINDLGCTLKVMRRDILKEVPLYGDMHRFIPILLSQRGARCTEMITTHRPRIAGTTKYGIGRTFVVLLDLVTVKYLLDYAGHPMRLFGGLGLVGLFLSGLSLTTTLLMKIFAGVDMTGNPLLLMAVVLILASIQFLSIGIIGEVLARIYFSRDGRTHYAIRASPLDDRSDGTNV